MGLDNPLHIAFLVVILLLLFGAKRIPEIGRSLGSGLREFKQSINGEGPSHEHAPPTLPPAAPQAPVQPQAPTHQAPAQDAFAQRDPASTEQR
jgi:sec-independent protein translocase protein TatA